MMPGHPFEHPENIGDKTIVPEDPPVAVTARKALRLSRATYSAVWDPSIKNRSWNS
jgi:hypothetical protein